MVTIVPVLQIDSDLAEGVAESRLPAAVQACRAKVIELPSGRWEAVEELGGDRAGFGLLVLSGILCRRVVQGECNGAEVVGPGDLLRPWEGIGGWASIPTESTWLVIESGRVAILDESFVLRAAPYSEVSINLVRRALQRSRYLAVLVAIIGQRRIETRLTMLFWHLADRFGTLRGEWVEIPVPLTHAILAELVAARRPTVTTGLARLRERGVLRRSDSGWLLRGTVPPELSELRNPASQDTAARESRPSGGPETTGLRS